MRKILMFNTERFCYATDQLRSDETLTVGELIEILSWYDEDTPILQCNDNGYTYGRFSECDFVEKMGEFEDDYEEEGDEEE